MRRIALVIGCMALPLGVCALDYSDQSLMYMDAPFRPAEAAGISLLTTIGAVQGNPDGTFLAARTLNRAEFLKIALLSYPRIAVSTSDASRCFPDIREEDWFSPYVCLAKKRDIIAGYPDGNFRPGNPVNYAEALKILGELYEYTAYAEPNALWYELYVQAAKNHKTILPIFLPYDRYITRGQMARLAAAYRAEYSGELEKYRKAELGKHVVVIAPPEPEPQPEPEPEPEPQPELPPPQSTVKLPVQSSILLVGKRAPIADAKLYVQESPVELRQVKITLEKEARSLRELSIEDGSGAKLGTLKLDLRDRTNKTWIVNHNPGDTGYVFPAEQPTTVVLYALIEDRGAGGFSEDLIDVKSMLVIVGETEDATISYQIVPSGAHYPIHQTAQARITGVHNALADTGELEQGDSKKLASFRIEREVHPEMNFRVRHLRFHVRHSLGTRVTNWEIRSGDAFNTYSCTTEKDDVLDRITVNCLALPEEIGRGDVFDLYGSVDLTEASRGDSFQVNLEISGSLSQQGDVRWTDGSADFQWTDMQMPLPSGTLWTY